MSKTYNTKHIMTSTEFKYKALTFVCVKTAEGYDILSATARYLGSARTLVGCRRFARGHLPN